MPPALLWPFPCDSPALLEPFPTRKVLCSFSMTSRTSLHYALSVPKDSPQSDYLGSHWLHWDAIGPGQAEIRCDRETKGECHQQGLTSHRMGTTALSLQGVYTDRPAPQPHKVTRTETPTSEPAPHTHLSLHSPCRS